MVVDDDREILSLIREIVGCFSNVEVECFHSPQEALAAFESRPGAFQLVITDLEMPEMSGIELCHHLRALTPSLKILLSTGSELLSDEEAVEVGFCGLLRKPFTLATLQNVLEAASLSGLFDIFQKFHGLNGSLRCGRIDCATKIHSAKK